MRTHRAFPLAAALAMSAACIVEVPAPGGSQAPAPPPPAAAQPSGGAVPDGAAAARELAVLVNRHRQSIGCPALAWLDGAGRAAQEHSEDMARRNYFDHNSPDGGTPSTRVIREGVRYRMLAENIAMTERGPADALALWVRSPGHRANLHECSFTHHGIGVARGRYTHVLVVPTSEPMFRP